MAFRVEVYESGIVALIQVGDGLRWIRSKAKAVETRARLIVPVRTHALQASHRTEQNRNALGRYQSGFIVSANTHYARFVHDGTRGMPGRWAKLPGRNANPNRVVGKHGTVVFGVRGQRANPWLERAAHDVIGV